MISDIRKLIDTMETMRCQAFRLTAEDIKFIAMQMRADLEDIIIDIESLNAQAQ